MKTERTKSLSDGLNARGISRRDFCTSSALAAGAFVLGGTAHGTEKSGNATCKNVLLITTDDQGVEAGCYGDPLARTPNIDALAADGVRFERGYITQASCSPSRSSILTGLYPHQNGQLGLAHEAYKMHDGIPTLQRVLKDAGYTNGIIGKLHVAPFEAFPIDMDERRWKSSRDVRGVADVAAEFLETHGDKPFFLMVNYLDPHRPYEKADQVKGLPEKPMTPEEAKPFPFLNVDSPAVRDEVAAYYNCIERADAGIGMVLDALERSGHKDDTVVVFLGDHGAPFTRAKTTCYEAGDRVPFVVRWPGVSKAGMVSHGLVSSVDIMPTVLEAVGVEAPSGLAGRSVAQLCQGNDAGWRETVCAEYTSHTRKHYFPRRSIFDGRYKLIRNLLTDRPNPVPSIGPGNRALTKEGSEMRKVFDTYLNPPEVELYDIEKDPVEFHNLADDPAHADIRKRLSEGLQAWREETDDQTLDPAYLAALTKEHDEWK